MGKKADDNLAQLRAQLQQLKTAAKRWQNPVLSSEQSAALRKQQLVLSPEQAASLRRREAEKLEEADRQKRARQILDRDAAIQNGLIPPPWAEKLLKPARKAEPKPKRERKKPQRDLLPPVLLKLWENGVPPEDLPDPVVVKQVSDKFDEHYKGRNFTTPGRLTILRAVGRLVED